MVLQNSAQIVGLKISFAPRNIVSCSFDFVEDKYCIIH